MAYFVFIIFGYLSGSVMYSQLLPAFFRHVDITKISDDGNPGAGNVFKQLGPSMGLLCLLCDIFKGTIPVALCLHYLSFEPTLFGLVLAAPVLGHAKKGKAIAVSFGVLLGLVPFSMMIVYLILPFLFFSVIIRINPHAWRVILSFLCFMIATLLRVPVPALQLGALLIALTVGVKHLVYIKSTHEHMHVEKSWSFSKLRKGR